MATLSEAEAKRLVAARGIPVPVERLVTTPEDAVAAAEAIGFPVVAKLCGPSIAHKTERGLVRLALTDAAGVRRATSELLGAARPGDGDVAVLVAETVRGNRELIAGVVRDPQIGPCVMLGVGGILAEAVGDVAFRVTPVARVDAAELIEDLASQSLLGPFRGEPAVDRGRLADILVGLSDLVEADGTIRAIDLNPLIVADGVPVAVDALVEVEDQ